MSAGTEVPKVTDTAEFVDGELVLNRRLDFSNGDSMDNPTTFSPEFTRLIVDAVADAALERIHMAVCYASPSECAEEGGVCVRAVQATKALP